MDNRISHADKVSKRANALKERYRMFVINQHNISPGGTPTDGLIHYWPLHAVKTDLIAGKNWVANGAETYGTNRKGEANKAAVFVDNTTYFQLASDLNIGKTYTISLWFYGVIQAPIILNKYATSAFPYLSGDGSYINMRLATETVQWFLKSQDGGINVNNTWYHFILTRNGTKHNVYRNNIDLDDNEKTSATDPDYIIRTLNKRYNSADNLYALNGKLSDVRIYNRVLTTDEITALYNE